MVVFCLLIQWGVVASILFPKSFVVLVVISVNFMLSSPTCFGIRKGIGGIIYVWYVSYQTFLTKFVWCTFMLRLHHSYRKNVFRDKTTKINLQTPSKSSQVCLSDLMWKAFLILKSAQIWQTPFKSSQVCVDSDSICKSKSNLKTKNKKLTIHQNSTSWKTDQMIVDYGGWFWRGRKTRGLVQHRAVRDTLLCDWDFRHPFTFTIYLFPQVFSKSNKYSLSLSFTELRQYCHMALSWGEDNVYF